MLNSCSQHCSVCPFAKQKQPFDSFNNMCDETFSLMHSGIWDPCQYFTNVGHRFFATIMDDKNIYTWIYLLKLNSDIQLMIPNSMHMFKLNPIML